MVRVLFDLGDGLVDDRRHVFVPNEQQDRCLGVSPNQVAE
jgi:hypothetical protein